MEPEDLLSIVNRVKALLMMTSLDWNLSFASAADGLASSTATRRLLRRGMRLEGLVDGTASSAEWMASTRLGDLLALTLE